MQIVERGGINLPGGLRPKRENDETGRRVSRYSLCTVGVHRGLAFARLSRTHRNANPGRARARQREAGRAGRGRLGFRTTWARFVVSPLIPIGTRGDPVRELVQILLAVG